MSDCKCRSLREKVLGDGCDICSPSKFIPGSYKDIKGNDCSLFHLVKESPEWACSRIREGEKAAAELAELREFAFVCIEMQRAGLSTKDAINSMEAALQEKGE